MYGMQHRKCSAAEVTLIPAKNRIENCTLWQKCFAKAQIPVRTLLKTAVRCWPNAIDGYKISIIGRIFGFEKLCHSTENLLGIQVLPTSSKMSI
jgi:hypothetical protein